MEPGALASLRELLAHNQFFSGGAVLMAVGAAAGVARQLPARLWALLQRRFVLSLEIHGSDEAFGWFKHWLDAHPSARHRRDLVLTTLFDRDEQPAGGQMPRVLFTPAPGRHLVLHGRRWLLVTIKRREPAGRSEDGRPQESFVIQTLGTRRETLVALVEEAYAAARHAEPGVQVHALAKWEGWRKVAVRGPRPPESMILAEGLFERLAADVRGFLDARGWYGSLGIPWKRGFLLYGPPGNGKSSLVLAIATMLGCDLYLLNLANAAVDDESLPALLSQVPCGSVVLIEEIDTLFDQREKTREGASRLTFGGLLSALDGPASQEGLLLFMTTNHPEKLDPALVRPGRIDLQLAIENPTPRQVQRLFERFYPQAAPHLAHLAAERVPAGQWGMAVLQEHFMRFRDDPEGAVEALPQETSRNQAAAETPRPHCLVARV